MATGTAFQTYNATINREDLSDIITNISPEETPMYTDFAKGKAKSTYHEWAIENLESATANSQAEGADYSFSALTARTRTGNYTQILSKTWEVSATQEAVDTAGIESEYQRRLMNAMKEVKRDTEYALVNGTVASGASGTARTLKGVLSWISTNVETGTGSASEALTESMLNNALQDAWNQGGSTDSIYANGYQKRQISSFTTNTRDVAASEKAVYRAIDVYDSDFGRHAVKLDRYMPAAQVAILQLDKWAVGTLRPFTAEKVAKVGDSHRGAIVGELTCISYNEAASAKITGLSTGS